MLFGMIGLLLTGLLAAAPGELGVVDFPTSCKPAAQTHFSQGVLLLHSFFYDEAALAFVAAEQADPNCAMAYWGEAMTHNHPLWEEQATESARAVLTRLKGFEQANAKEQGFIQAVRALFGAGDKKARDSAYADAMAKLHAAFPQDDEIALFHALALMGKPSGRDVLPRMQAGALSLGVLARKPKHPGAAHYVIHAFDDPEHAILALPAARKYAEIAPAAPHAQHMPSHIFVQLGLWTDAVSSNETAWAAAEAHVAQRKLDQNARDWHSESWLIALYLEQGRLGKARAALATFQEAMPRSRDARLRENYLGALEGYLQMTDEWSQIETFLAPVEKETSEQKASHAGCDTFTRPSQDQLRFALPLLRAQAAAHAGDTKATATQLRLARAHLDKDAAAPARKGQELALLLVESDLATAQHQRARAITLLGKATALEDALPLPSGPGGGRDAHTRLGELLLADKKAKEAAPHFSAALLRYPMRARPLLGAARAASALGDAATAQARYRELAAVWAQADANWPGLTETREHVAKR